MNKTPLEIFEEYRKADARDVEDFNNQFAWRSPGIEDRLHFTEFRLQRLISYVVWILQNMEQKKPEPPEQQK